VTVQTRRNPNNERFGMKHLGDITKIKGCDAPVVDCIIGGSPCQDLSLAGKRAGLAGARSGLYMEQIRIIKEMRHNDEQRGRTGESIRPRYMVWENVPGAFSTNGGKDFAAVLEEAIRVAEPEAPDVPVPEKGWPTSGCFFDEMGKWSVAWRVLDAQFWGVPQRRRRIALVADFGGQSASEILFIRKSVSGDIEPGKPKGKEVTGDVGESSGGAVKAVGFPLGFRPENVRLYDELATTLCNGTRPGFTTGVVQDQTLFQPVILDDQGSSQISVRDDGKCPTLRAEMHGNVPCVLKEQHLFENHSQDSRYRGSLEVCPMLPARPGTGGNNTPFVVETHADCFQTYQKVTGPLMANSHPGSYTGQDAFSDMLVAGVDCRNATEYPELNGTLQSKPGGGFSLNCNQVVRVRYIVRRLTPLECERLQGFPDGWTNIGEWVDSKGKKHKEADSPRYKALGNSIAIPPWKWVLKRLCACYERDATMASLFDGIGGFPYIWEQLNGKGSCLWASEIEEFPMAVTKIRFGGED
jgi:DNA (cytosine-5)-methyltransferase 1